jgi:ankyrin repeat-rich membrane spanning protein
LELDRDERKLDAFLQLHKSDLLVSDLRIFLPFTINLDPYLRKVLKEDQQAMEDEGIMITAKATPPQPKETVNQYISPLFSSLPGIFSQPPPQPMPMINYYTQTNRAGGGDQHFGLQQRRKVSQGSLAAPFAPPSPAPTASKFNFDDQLSIDVDLSLIKLSKLSVDDIIEILNHVKEIKPAMEQLAGVLKQNAISGRVLVHCELGELKSVLNLCFGHWEIFKILVLYLREVEKTTASNVVQQHKKDNYEISEHPPVVIRPKPQNVMEKQVSLEGIKGSGG